MRECATNSSSDSRDTYGDQERDTRVENVAHIGAVGEIGLHAHHPRGNLFVLPIDVGLERGVQLLDVRLLELRDVGVADRGLDHVGDLLAQKVGREPHDVAAQVDHRDSLVHVPHGLEQLLDDGSGAIVSITGRESERARVREKWANLLVRRLVEQDKVKYIERAQADKVLALVDVVQVAGLGGHAREDGLDVQEKLLVEDVVAAHLDHARHIKLLRHAVLHCEGK